MRRRKSARSVLSRVCNARGHRSRNISCQVRRTDRCWIAWHRDEGVSYDEWVYRYENNVDDYDNVRWRRRRRQRRTEKVDLKTRVYGHGLSPKCERWPPRDFYARRESLASHAKTQKAQIYLYMYLLVPSPLWIYSQPPWRNDVFALPIYGRGHIKRNM